MRALLEVVATSVADAERAAAGGADRIELVGATDDGGMSPEPALMEQVRGAVDVEVRCRVRLREGYGTDGGEAVRLRGLISAYLDAGADGMSLGFLNGLGAIDLEVVDALTLEGDWPWTFHRAFDAAFDTDRAWAALLRTDACPGLERLDSVVTAGSARGVESGLDDLVGLAVDDERIRPLIMAGGGLAAEHVPWLVRAGVRQFRVGTPVRLGRRWDAPVEDSLVRAWRTLLDSTVAHVEGGR